MKLAVTGGFLLLLALVAKPIWEGREQWQFGPFRDDGVYMVTAKSLAEGGGYRQDNLPDRRILTKYPPLYPLYLSVAWRIQPSFPRVLETAAWMQALLLPILLALILAALRQLDLTWNRAFLAAALTVVSYSVISLTTTLYSELLFGCFVMAAIWAIEHSAGETDHAVRWALAGGLLTGLAYLTRNAALPMLAAAPIFYLLRKRIRLAAWFLIFPVQMAAAWHIWGALHPAAGMRAPYAAELLEMIRTVGFVPLLLKQAALLSASVAEEVVPGIINFEFGLPLHHLVLAAGIAGGIRIAHRRRWPVAFIFSALTLVMIVLWWGERVGRFLLPVWPFLMAGLVEEGSHFADLCAKSIRRHSAPRWALIAVAVFLVIRNAGVGYDRVHLKVTVEKQERLRDMAAYRWIANHAGPGAVVLTSKDALSSLYTGVPASHDIFVTVVPQPEVIKTPREPLSTLPAQFSSVLVLLLPSDFEDFTERGMAGYHATLDAIPGSRMEVNGPGGTIYRFPIVR